MKDNEGALKTPARSKWINTFVRGPKPLDKNFRDDLLAKLANKEKNKVPAR